MISSVCEKIRLIQDDSKKVNKMNNLNKSSLKIFNGILPSVHPSVFLADGVKVIGQVLIGAESSLWFNTVCRGDVNSITIGEGTNIQDNTIIDVRERRLEIWV